MSLKQFRFLILVMVLSFLGLEGCASWGSGQQGILVEVETQPSGEAVALRGRLLGAAPVELTTRAFADVMEISPVRKDLAVVERRVVVLDPDRVRVFLRMEGEPSPLAKKLGLAEITVFDYGDRASFDTDSFEIRPSLEPMLKRQAKLLKTRFRGIDLYLCGHTDSSGETDHNGILSVRRAEAVANFLTSSGIEKWRVQVQGFGADFPIAANATAEGRALNRRTEIILPD